ncbi:MAG TPA: PRC-barrel domain-containing protein [Candidatus Norongarragalinales archaeon]|jgi:sporulation protein YlmC with PRC-barrel domain|nr:PRC-barrel domain-containing protein [Candidatus Norongarragalinales archaeon]
MVKYAIAKQLAGKRIITTDGEEIGRVIDLYMNELTGKLESVLVEPNPDSSLALRARKEGAGLVALPYSAVLDVKDVMVMDRRGIGASE